MKGNLGVNDCIVALEEKELDHVAANAEVGGAARKTFLPTHCTAHSCVLGMKPIISALGSIGKLVKLSHLLESGKRHTQYVDAAKAICKKRFAYHWNEPRPVDFAQWQLHHKRVMEASRPAQDLTTADENLILAAANGSWDLETERFFSHWCWADCPLECKGDASKAFTQFVAAVVLAVCGRMNVPLEYRWKGFESAQAWLMRNREMGDLLRLSLEEIYPVSVRDRARLDLQRANELGLPADDPQVVRNSQAIRAGVLITWLREDKGGASLAKGVALTAPQQGFLNHVFSADKMNGKLLDMLSDCVPASMTLESVEEQDALLDEAAMLNWQILSGARGREVLAKFDSMLQSYSDEAWRKCVTPTRDDEKFSCSLLALPAYADAWKRLDFDMKVSRLRILEVGTIRLPAAEGDVERICRPLEDARAKCARCVDKGFTSIWLERLRASNACRNRAVRCLKDKLAVTPIMSGKTERKHIVGQTMRPRKRGRAPTALHLARRSYTQVVHAMGKTKSRRVEHAIVGKGRRALQSFSQLVSSMALGRVKRGKLTRASFVTGKLQPRKKRGGDLYYAERFRELPAGLTIGQKRKLCWQEYRALPAAQRAQYEERGKADEPSVDSFAAMRAKGRCKSPWKRAATLRRTLQEMRQHPTWQAGAGNLDYGGGLQHDKMSTLTQKDVDAACNDRFAFDPWAKANPPGTMVPETTCWQRAAGLCLEDELFENVDNAAYNLHLTCKRRQMVKRLPLVCKLSAGAGEHYAIMMKFFLRPVVTCVLLPCTDDGGIFRPTLDGGNSVETSHQLIARVLRAASQELLLDANTFEHCSVSLLPLVKAEGADGFAFRCGEPLLATELLLQQRMNRRKKQAPTDEEFQLPFGFVLKEKFTEEEGKKNEAGFGEDGDASDDPDDPREEKSCPSNPPDSASEDSSGEGTDAEGPNPKPEVPEAPPPPQPAEKGMQSFGQAPSGTAKCPLCTRFVDKDEWRFEATFPAHTKIKFTRRIHIGCVNRLPHEAKEHDLEKLRQWMADSEWAHARVFLRRAYKLRSGPSGASSSGQAG